MKVRMISDYSERPDHPKKDDELHVLDKIYEDGELDRYECRWKEGMIIVYPDECQEL